MRKILSSAAAVFLLSAVVTFGIGGGPVIHVPPAAIVPGSQWVVDADGLCYSADGVLIDSACGPFCAAAGDPGDLRVAGDLEIGGGRG